MLISTSRKIVIIAGATFFALGANYLYAAWSGPSSAPPDGNVAAPVNVGDTSQIKSGALSVDDAFTVWGNGYYQGNLGVGVVSPTYKVDVAGTVNATQYCISGANCISAWPSGGGSSQWTTSGSNIYYNTGNVGVGTANPSQKLQVAGYVRGDTGLCIGSDCRTSWPTGGSGGSGTVTSIIAGTGLTGGTITTSGTIAADTSYLQRRVSSSCTSGNAIRVIASDGSVTCEAVSGGGGGSGTINSGTTNRLTYYSGSTAVSSSGFLYTDNTNSRLGIGVASPSQTLDVSGYVKAGTGFCIGASCITSWPSGGSGIGGSGTTNKIAKFTAGTTLGDSLIYDNGTRVGINTTNPSTSYTVDVDGSINANNVYSEGTFIATGAASGFTGTYLDAADGLINFSPGSLSNKGGAVFANVFVDRQDSTGNKYVDPGGISKMTTIDLGNTLGGGTLYTYNIVMGQGLTGGTIWTHNISMDGTLWGVFVSLSDRGNATNGWFTTSDERLKKNIEPIKDSLAKVISLRGVSYDWIKNREHQVGVIAQEVERVVPEAVETNSDGYKSVNYDKLVPLLIEAVKEQQKQIEELRSEVENLKNLNK